MANAHRDPAHQNLIRRLVAMGKPLVEVGFGGPYDLAELPGVDTYVAVYGYNTPNLAGVGALLCGRAPARGRLPVSIPGHCPQGYGLPTEPVL